MNPLEKPLNTDPKAIAIHEIGHATAQAIWGVGPQHVKISPKGEGWEGQSLPFADALEDQKRARTYATQLAGPIAQIVCAGDSLDRYRMTFADELLVPAFKLWNARDPALRLLGWERDLELVLFKANSTASTWIAAEFETIRQGGFLHQAELALFLFFRNPNVSEFVGREGARLIAEKQIDGAAFALRVRVELAQDAQAALLDLSLDFVPGF